MSIVNEMFYLGGGEPTTGLASDLLSGKTLNNEDGDNVVGTMSNNGDVGGTITQQAGRVIIPAGYTSGGQVEANIANLKAANVKQGAIVGGVAGDFTSDATALAGDILTNKTAYANGAKITGSMTDRGTITQTISTQGGQYTVPAGYHNGSGKVTASFSNLIPANVKSGVNIGNVVGAFSGQTKTGTVRCVMSHGGSEYPTFCYIPAVSGIGFRPKAVYGYYSGTIGGSFYRAGFVFVDFDLFSGGKVFGFASYGSDGDYYHTTGRLYASTNSMTNDGWVKLDAGGSYYASNPHYPLLATDYNYVAIG